MNKRRRGINSEWILALDESRRARALRNELPIPTTYRQHYIEQGSEQHLVDDDLHVASTGGERCEESEESLSELDGCMMPVSDVVDAEADKLGGAFEDDRHAEEHNTPEHSHAAYDDDIITAGEMNRSEHNSDRELLQPSAGLSGDDPDTAPHALDSGAPDIEMLECRLKKWENRHLLSAVIAVNGSVRLTVKQYEYVRTLLRDVTPDSSEVWPPYSTIQRCFKTLLDTCMPRSSVANLPTQTRKERKLPSTLSTELEESRVPPAPNVKTAPVRIFYPSGWAKLDVSTSPFFDTNCAQHFENSGIVRLGDRSYITDASRLFFVAQGGINVECRPGATITVSAQRRGPFCQTPFNVTQGENDYSFNAEVVATWTVGSTSFPNPSWKNHSSSDQLTTGEERLLRFLSTGQSRPYDTNEEEDFVLPGDLCTILKADRDVQSHEYAPVIVHRFWRYEVGIPSVLLLWMRPRTQSDASSENEEHTSDLDVAATHVISNICLRRQAHNRNLNDQPNRSCRGTPADGTPYVVYRMLLYCDDFQKSSYSGSSGSAGGCYFMPLAIPPEERRKTSSVRLISLTPPGVSTNDVLRYIVPDIVESTFAGVQGRTRDGQRVRIFLDIVGFIGDYPASSEVIDVLGHVARAPCTLCTFRRPHAADADGSRYGYTTDIHANNSTFLSNAERHDSLRRSNISDNDANMLGMASSDRTHHSPLLYLREALSKEMTEGADIPIAGNGLPVVPGTFDPFRCNVIAPDHLLTGLSKDILNVVFLSLSSKELRLQADIHICAALRDNGLPRQKEVFNSRTNTIHSMTLSELFCVLLVAVPTLRIVTSSVSQHEEVHEALRLLNKLHHLVRLTYLWPQKGLDGMAAEEFFQRDSENYFAELKRLSKEYIQAVDVFCAQSAKGKTHLDKPNFHRLLELYEHSLPAFGHVREFMELIFESVHQPLKRSISNGNNHDEHIFAVEQCVGNDWQGRLASMSREITHDNEERQSIGKRALRRLMLGAEVDLVPTGQNREFIEETDRILANLFTPAVKQHFSGNNLVANYARRKDPT